MAGAERTEGKKKGNIIADWSNRYKTCKDFKEPWEQTAAKAGVSKEAVQKAILFPHSEYQTEDHPLRRRAKAGWKVCAPGKHYEGKC